MADFVSTPASIKITSYDTALCIIPPQPKCEDINKLRSLYDKAYGRWPPYISLIYPFVSPENLPQAKERLSSHLHGAFGEASSLTVVFGGAGLFKHRKDTTVFLQQKEDGNDNVLPTLRSAALQALGQKASPCNFHLTVGQAQDSSVSARQFLLNKANLFPSLEFNIGSLAILIREKSGNKGNAESPMRLWGTIDLLSSRQSTNNPTSDFWIVDPFPTIDSPCTNKEIDVTMSRSPSFGNRPLQPGPTYEFNHNARKWCISTVASGVARPSALSISSYNVLVDSEYPPAHGRDPLVVEAILAESASADILILQEVSDDFLSYLLQVEEVQKAYPFTSHGPPSQADICPLPSLRNIVLLSKWHFDWEFLPFHRRHKDAIIASFPLLLNSEQSTTGLLVVAGVHLTAGLTDGSVAAKKVQLQNVVNHMKRNYPTSAWLVAGDFNLPTSRYTIDEAVKEESISAETSRVLASTETTLAEMGLLDAWAVARVEGVDETTVLDADDLFEGEEGATFNPRENALAAYISGTSQNRPQRYDRIFMRSLHQFALARFNLFGLPQSAEGTTSVPSDHFGVRAVFKIHSDTGNQNRVFSDMVQQRTVLHKHAPEQLSCTADLMKVLSERSGFPTAEDEDHYARAFALIKDVLLGVVDTETHSTDIPMVIVAVGSYALNVWTPQSDIDCLCIGSISSKTFFQLACQRIKRAKVMGVRLLRKVQANTGTMLELSVNGVNVDLQYCPAANVVQRWTDFPHLSASDPIFNLPILSLRKLKPIRDLTYIQRTIPSMASFRLAYHMIKQWAVTRGIYSAKFGYLGGIHITLMLSWVAKRLAHDVGTPSASDLILSFFHYYAHFDWQNDMVYDAFCHKTKPRYQRSAREPMVILGFHAPNSNIAHTATASGLKVLDRELRQANDHLSTAGTTWDQFLSGDTTGTTSVTSIPALEKFLSSYPNYLKIDVQYWGRTLSRGKNMVGWVESRCINLVVDIHKALPNLSSRIWPARFAERDASDADTYYHGCYLIGLSHNREQSTALSKEDRSEARSALNRTVDRFLTQMRTDDKYYDENAAWIGASLVSPSEVKDLQLDVREWGDCIPDIDADSDDEVDPGELEKGYIPTTSRKLPLRSTSSGIGKPVSSNKLRPASDILNRLRWDPDLDPSEYIVGYEDRFLGVKETALDKWKTEQTEEEFIPQHRILHFKKKGEDGGEVVWERATRIDKIFGSGNGKGE